MFCHQWLFASRTGKEERKKSAPESPRGFEPGAQWIKVGRSVHCAIAPERVYSCDPTWRHILMEYGHWSRAPTVRPSKGLSLIRVAVCASSLSQTIATWLRRQNWGLEGCRFELALEAFFLRTDRDARQNIKKAAYRVRQRCTAKHKTKNKTKRTSEFRQYEAKLLGPFLWPSQCCVAPSLFRHCSDTVPTLFRHWPDCFVLSANID